MRKEEKIKLAIITNGGINAGHNNQGVPTLMKLAFDLHKTTDLTIYTLSKPTTKNQLNVKYIPGSGIIKAGFFLVIFLPDLMVKKYDIIQAFWGRPAGKIAALITKFLSVPSVVTLMGGETAALPKEGYGELRTEKGIKSMFNMMRDVTNVVAISKYQKDKLEETGFSNFEHFHEIPFGVSAEKRSIKKELKPPYRLILVANINPVKGHKTLIKAFEIIRKSVDVELTIVGGDFMNGEIHEIVRAQKLEKAIKFVGALANDEAVKLISDSDLMLISSISEGQSVVFAEAMAQGLPVCSTDVGLMRELSEISCLTSPVGNAELLAKNVIDLLHNEERYNELAKAGLQWTTENNADITCQKYMELYSKIIENDH